jgi:hypothetical protein
MKKKSLYVCMFVSGSKVKKTFSLFICFRVGSRGNLVWVETKVKKTSISSGFKGQKKHFLDFSRFVFNVKAWGSEMGSKVEKHWFLRVSTVKNALYTSEYHAQKKVNESDWFASGAEPMRCFCPLILPNQIFPLREFSSHLLEIEFSLNDEMLKMSAWVRIL